MFKSNNKIVSVILKLFLPLILFIGTIFVFTSLSIRDIDKEGRLSSDNLKDYGVSLELKQKREANSSKMSDFWKKVNLQEISIPSSVLDRAKDVQILPKRVNIMNIDTFYREALPPSGIESSHQSFLLLHGANFKSQTWVDLKTINQLAAMGHRVVAIDLPGYGETRSSLPSDKGNYLKEFIVALHLKNFVIVSPSMSGGFSIPYVIKNWQDIDGFVPVAPVSTNEIVHEGPKILTPTLIIYGELDTGLGITSRYHLSHLPNSQVVELPDAKHPAYLDQPDMFHTLLFNFMKQIKSHKGH